MLTKIKNKAKKLARGKKGVSQFVEMLIIIGVTVAVGGVVVGVVWKLVNDQKTKNTSAIDPSKAPATNG
jgi:hypothetical protein